MFTAVRRFKFAILAIGFLFAVFANRLPAQES
ncbi:MAG: hypothetical protein RIS70_3257, partial [Planctomycetota bacterium]